MDVENETAMLNGQNIRISKTTTNKRISRTAKMKKCLKAHLPILKWIGDYNTQWAINDLIAGITLGLTIIPESIACALLAGLPAHYGLCSAFIGSFIYLVFGSINNVIMGPTSLVALVSVQFTVGKPIEFAFLLTFLSGCVNIIFGSLQLGFIFEFISLPVIKAFSSATAVLVIESQLKVLLGIKYLVAGLPDSMRTLASRLHETNTGDLVMGACAITFLIAVDQINKFLRNHKLSKCQRTFLLYLSFSRNASIVFITAIMTFIWQNDSGTVPYTLSENSLSGLPSFTWPSLTVSSIERDYSFWDILNELKIGIIVIPIVGFLTNISIGKISSKSGFNTNQELITVGICNILGSCVQSMPTSGAFSRYAISTACGLKTPMANLYSGVIVLLALSYISQYFNYIPKATLAGILICSIYTLLDFQLPRRLWHQSKREFLLWLVCFFVCVLFGVEVGLFVSIIASLLHLLFVWARPDIDVKVEEFASFQYVRISPSTAIYFPASSHFRKTVLKACNRIKPCTIVVIDFKKVFALDYTAVQAISKLANDLAENIENENCKFLMILYRLKTDLQKLVELNERLTFCNDKQNLQDIILKSTLRGDSIEMKAEVIKDKVQNPN